MNRTMTIILIHTRMIRFRKTDKNTKQDFGELPRKKRTGQASD